MNAQIANIFSLAAKKLELWPLSFIWDKTQTYSMHEQQTHATDIREHDLVPGLLSFIPADEKPKTSIEDSSACRILQQTPTPRERVLSTEYNLLSSYNASPSDIQDSGLFFLQRQGYQDSFPDWDCPFEPIFSPMEAYAITQTQNGLHPHHDQVEVQRRRQGSDAQPFFPSTMVLQRCGWVSAEIPKPLSIESRRGSNAQALRDLNYRGHRRAESEHVLDAENCNTWVTGIPPTASYPHLFASITVGKIVTCHMVDVNDNFSTRAAHVTFAAPAAAARFITQARSDLGVRIFGRRLRVLYNEIGTRSFPGCRTRVLLIQGPSEVTTIEFFAKFFESKFVRHDDVVQHRCCTPGMTVIEWRFARIMCQAEWAKEAIEREPGFNIFDVKYGWDPCQGLHLT